MEVIIPRRFLEEKWLDRDLGNTLALEFRRLPLWSRFSSNLLVSPSVNRISECAYQNLRKLLEDIPKEGEKFVVNVKQSQGWGMCYWFACLYFRLQAALRLQKVDVFDEINCIAVIGRYFIKGAPILAVLLQANPLLERRAEGRLLTSIGCLLKEAPYPKDSFGVFLVQKNLIDVQDRVFLFIRMQHTDYVFDPEEGVRVFMGFSSEDRLRSIKKYYKITHPEQLFFFKIEPWD